VISVVSQLRVDLSTPATAQEADSRRITGARCDRRPSAAWGSCCNRKPCWRKRSRRSVLCAHAHLSGLCAESSS